MICFSVKKKRALNFISLGNFSGQYTNRTNSLVRLCHCILVSETEIPMIIDLCLDDTERRFKWNKKKSQGVGWNHNLVYISLSEPNHEQQKLSHLGSLLTCGLVAEIRL